MEAGGRKNCYYREKRRKIKNGGKEMGEIADLIMNYGVMIVIVAIFLWDYIANKKEIKKTLETMKETNINISNCLKEMKSSNNNTEKSLDILQKSMDNQSMKIDKLLEMERGK